MNPGDIVVVRFPFADLATTKKRPALLLARIVRSPRNQLAVVAMITSRVEAARIDGDVLIAEWKAAGLLHPSLLRLAKVATIDDSLMDKAVGRLHARDLKTVREAFSAVFRDWVR